ncbi:TonB dependent receptor protein [Janthinobacterium sp. HH01]|uniref:TonB-dependent receptor n=1 Tax=Janthinobacterium sp. HH01 TaxID=1198452 RepID=UPI0002AEA456|nr:TonB dependent receptor protein [Janthinobacterium sp. HH01]
MSTNGCKSRALAGLPQLCFALVVFGPWSPAKAQAPAVPGAGEPDTAGQLETVIVTAQRRAENIKNVPMSISTIKDENLDVLTSGGRDIRFLASRTPSLHVESDFGRSFPRFYLRGLGNVDFDMNASQPVSLVFDDVVQENPLLKGFPLFDIDQIEVLRGPQGSLFGRNSPAGVIKFDSVKPGRREEGYLNVGLGNYGIKNVDGAWNKPLGEAWAARLSWLTQHRDNRVHNPRPDAPTHDFEGYHDSALRFQLLYQPGEHFSALFNVHAREMGGRATVFRANIIQRGSNELVPGFDYSVLPTDGVNRQALESKGASARLRWVLGQWTLHSISAYESVTFYSRGDVDAGFGSVAAPPMGPGVIPFASETADGLPKHKQLTQELRLESNYPGPLNWIGGLYYFYEDIQVDSFNFDTFAGNRQNAYAVQLQKSRSWASFLSLAYAPNEQLKLRAGLRYTDDDRDLTASRTMAAPGASLLGPLQATPHSSNVSWDASADYELSKTSQLYARVATGYRAPSIQGRILFGNSISVANAEHAISYEVGLKQDLFNKHARGSLSLFRYSVKDMQLTAGSGTVNQNRLINAAKVEGHGVEGEFQANLSDALKLSVGGSYNDVRIKDPALFVLPCGNGCAVLDPSGSLPRTVLVNNNPLPRSPKWIGNISLRYGRPFGSGEFFVYTDCSYRGKYDFFLYEAKEYVSKPLFDAGIRGGYKWHSGKYELAAFVRNIGNKVVLVNAIDFNNMTGVVSEPRIVGIQLKVIL